ncbi:MAG: hypothetical protein KKD24_04335 [Proteobacteria bacterium]|nr:hypothetical protein [Pseudomonadota bacterium]
MKMLDFNLLSITYYPVALTPLPLIIAEYKIPWYACVEIMEVFYAQHRGHHSRGRLAPRRRAYHRG